MIIIQYQQMEDTELLECTQWKLPEEDKAGMLTGLFSF